MDDDDENLWAEVTKDVQRMKRPKKPPQEKPTPKQSPQSVPESPSKNESQFKPLAKKPAEDNPGLDRRTADRLRKGQMPIEARLDLHGMSQAKAHEALKAFILQSYQSGLRCVLVITGKGAGADGRRDPLSPGLGVLKAAVPQWLNEPPCKAHVLQSAPARPQHGGGGALYVLLRRRR